MRNVLIGPGRRFGHTRTWVGDRTFSTAPVLKALKVSACEHLCLKILAQEL